MKKWLFLFFFFLSVAAFAQNEEGKYPWNLTMFAGGAKLCDEDGCFGPSGFAVGLAFGRQFTSHWSFELDGTYVRSNENEVPRFDDTTGIFFVPVLQRTRIWGGATFLRSVKHFGNRSDLFIAVGGVGAFERQTEKVPSEVFPLPSKNLGIKGGVSGGAGLNLWFSRTWGIRPEARFYACATPLSGLRYTAGLIHQFQ
jgi:hypothetical protein